MIAAADRWHAFCAVWSRIGHKASNGAWVEPEPERCDCTSCSPTYGDR